MEICCGSIAQSVRRAVPRRCNSCRQFGSSPYRRLLWKPAFPSDLPPALRQNAAVIRHAAPEVSPVKKTWTIHASRRLHDLAPELCEKGASRELAANVIYWALAAVDCKCPQEAFRRETGFRSDLFTACSNLFEVHHVHAGAENIFAVLNADVIREVAPAMKGPRRRLLRHMVVETVEEWVHLHTDSFGLLDASKLFEVVGPETFMSLIPRLGLSVRALSGEDVEVLLFHLSEEAKDLFGTLRVALSLLPVDDLGSSLGGSSWTMRRVLALIEQRRSEPALRFLLSHLYPSSLIQEVLAALRERDFDTGLLREKWSFFVSTQLQADVNAGRPILSDMPNVWPALLPPVPANYDAKASAIDESREIPRGQKMWVTDGEFMPFSFQRRAPIPLSGIAPPSRFRDTPWPHLAFDPKEAVASDSVGSTTSLAVDAYDVLDGKTDDIEALSLWTGDAANVSASLPGSFAGLPHQNAALPLDAIHFVDSVQALSHVLTFLQETSPAFLGIDTEWSDPQPISIIQIATPSRAFVLDTVNRTPLYMAVLFVLVDWILKREETTKLFFGFPTDLIRLNLLFEPQGKSFGSADHLTSIVDLYMNRVRREVVPMPRMEDTPLGREELLGDALVAGDLSEVQRLSATSSPKYPPLPRLGEKVFTVGGHHSLASMVERYLGDTLDKSYRRSNWNFRPLSAMQVVYAATDAHVLLRLESAMREQGVLPQQIWGGPRRGISQPAWWRPDAVDVSGEFL